MFQKQRALFLGSMTCVAMAVVIGAASMPARAQVVSPPRNYQIGTGDVPGWHVDAIQTSRLESNWRAWSDSQPNARSLYRGAWGSLGRVTGWYESLRVSRGPAEAEAVVLVSEFSSVAGAAHAYHVILPRSTALVPLAIGAHAAEWPTSGGVASGPGLVSHFGGFTTYLQAGATVVEIHTDVGAKQGQMLGSPLPNPGRAIALRLARVAVATVSPAARMTAGINRVETDFNGGRYVALSSPRRAYRRGSVITLTIRMWNTSNQPLPFRWQCHQFAALHFVAGNKDLGPVPLFAEPPPCSTSVSILFPHRFWETKQTIRLLRPQIAAQVTMILHNVDTPGTVDVPVLTRSLTFSLYR